MEQLLLRRGDFSKALPQCQSINLADNDDAQISGFQIDLPALSSRESEGRVDALILAWVLLLYRGSFDQGSEELDWGYASFGGQDTPVQKITAAVNDGSVTDTDQISEKLEAIRKLRTSQAGEVNEFVLAASSKADVCL